VSSVFRDNGATIYDFHGNTLVRCPRCRRRAFAYGTADDPSGRFVCTACGLAKYKRDVGPGVTITDGPYDPCFCLPVWLQTTCAGHKLWAYNLKHLEFLESYVSATHRLRDRRLDGIGCERQLACLLPKWITAAKSRGEVLRALSELRRMADA
jgi:hypothetical protein